MASTNAAEEQVDSLAAVKTAYLYNIAKFVDWPGEEPSITLCVQSDSRMRSYLGQLDSRPIGKNRQLHVVVRDKMAGDCHIFYTDQPGLSADQITSSTAAVQQVSHQEEADTRVLSVSDHSRALELGYAVQFLVEEGKLRFRFSQQVLQDSSFKVSSKLLVLASKGKAG